MPVTDAYRPEPRFCALGPGFADAVEPANFPTPVLRWRDQRAAATIGLEALDDREWRSAFAHFEPLPGNLNPPLAMRYHGHQFRTYNPQIGDGRGFLFAQMRDASGRLMDIGTKGTGQTPWSRTGDGRMTLQAGVREALIAQLLTARGVPGCAILSLYETGEVLERHDEPSPAQGAVMARLQHSHVRIGTFQRHAHEGNRDAIAALLDHAVTLYHPSADRTDTPEKAVAFLAAVTHANARLAAHWMAAGFVHGVLNSDNMTVTGASFDYGPSRFLPVYAPDFVAAYFDSGGIYAYARQAEATFWNLQRLAETLTLIAPIEPLKEVLTGFEPAYSDAIREAFCARFGVTARGPDEDAELVRAFTRFALATRLPFEAPFFDLFGAAERLEAAPKGARSRYYAHESFGALRAALSVREPAQPASHPYFDGEEPAALPIETVRAVWSAIEDDGDWSGFEAAMAHGAAAREAYALA